MSQHLGHCSPNRREDYDIIIMFCEQVCLCASHVDLRVVVENRSRSESRKPLSRMGMSTSLICVDDNAAYQPSSPNIHVFFTFPDTATGNKFGPFLSSLVRVIASNQLARESLLTVRLSISWWSLTAKFRQRGGCANHSLLFFYWS